MIKRVGRTFAGSCGTIRWANSAGRSACGGSCRRSHADYSAQSPLTRHCLERACERSGLASHVGWPRQLVVWVPQAQEASRYAFPHQARSLSSRPQGEISCDPLLWLLHSSRRSHRWHEISRYARNDKDGVGDSFGGVIHAERGNEDLGLWLRSCRWRWCGGTRTLLRRTDSTIDRTPLRGYGGGVVGLE